MGKEENAQEVYAIANSEEEAKAKLLDLLHEKLNATQRPLIRPKIPFFNLFFGEILPLILTIVDVLYLIETLKVWTFLIGLLAIFVCFARAKAILWILLYQKFAPEKVRRRCRYVPSCSEYALQSIRKYGLIKGGFRTAKRLRRCCPPNGGIDYP